MILEVLTYIQLVLVNCSHSMWKWLLHKITGKCELLRIQYDETAGAARTMNTESSLRNSKCPELQALIRPSDLSQSLAIDGVIRVKKISTEKHPIFRPRFTTCVEKIYEYRDLIDELELLRNKKYNESAHSKQLLALWKTLKPEEDLQQRFTRQWGDIGFQGEDPATDFRGMGMLGLENLSFFASQHNTIARQVLSHSNNPKYGYSFAIVGINLTSLCIHLLKIGELKKHFYNIPSKLRIENFHQLYCYVFYEFDKLWMKEKPNIMQFNEMRDLYEKQLLAELKNTQTQLRLAFLNSDPE